MAVKAEHELIEMALQVGFATQPWCVPSSHRLVTPDLSVQRLRPTRSAGS